MADRPITPTLDRVHLPADMMALSDRELRLLAVEVRAETISAVSVTGGHLGAGLGVVELTVALHAVFDTPRDKLIWDVGHQCYPHKILTGRRDRIRTLRTEGGLSGFTKRSESPYDPFGAAHSSTSISAALGFAMAADLGGDPADEWCVEFHRGAEDAVRRKSVKPVWEILATATGLLRTALWPIHAAAEPRSPVAEGLLYALLAP